MNLQKASLLVSTDVNDIVLWAFQFQVLQWTGDLVSSPEQA